MTRATLKKASGEILDDAVAVRFVAPRSYTGEDSVELHTHGGTWVVGRVIERVMEAGARQALPGEFSFRAVRNGKMSLSQAQAVADLIAASNAGAASLALEKMAGSENRVLNALAEPLRRIAMFAEANIDFSDQDIGESAMSDLPTQLRAVISEARRLKDTFRRGELIQDGFRVALFGLPNAGKSSLFNALLGEDRSIVSEIAGTTRDVVRERLTLQGKKTSVTLRLEDLAGLQSTEDVVERIGIERALRSVGRADLVLVLWDLSAPVSEASKLIAEWQRAGASTSKAIGLFTKRDLVSVDAVSDARQALQAMGIGTWLETSARSTEGIPEAAAAIADFCETWVHREAGEVFLTHLDHVQAVEAAIEHLERACSAPSLDLLAADVRQALHSLSVLIGQTLPDDILGRVFSEFCIGK